MSDLDQNAICDDCGCPWDEKGECGCEPEYRPKCYECNGSGTTMEGWPCEICEGIGELDI